jgi:hypothetical protein
MDKQPVDKRRVNLIKDLIRNGREKTWQEYADIYGIETDRRARYYWEWYVENPEYYCPDYAISVSSSSTEETKEEVEKSSSEEQLDEVLENLGEYGTLTLSSVWQTVGKGGVIKTLGSWKNNVTGEDIEKFKETVIDEIKQFSPIRSFTKTNDIGGEEHMAEISFPDFHIGRVSVQESEELYASVIEKTIEGLSVFDLDKICYVVGNDWLNVDNSYYTTTKGTQQKDADDFPTTTRAGIRIALSSIYRLKELGVPIEVIIIPGNHDRFRMDAIGLALEGYFHNDLQVHIDAERAYRKYKQYGVSSFMYEHGELKATQYGITFATEEPHLWANTEYRYVRCGHLHHNIEREFSGEEVTFMPSFAENSDWEDSKAYISKRRGFAYIHSKTEGQKYRFEVKP